ncbi:MAG: hypothetical protein KDD62_07280, partial [Bdellovibrionales bacterium]|nr:hypothetical protein [Bdellovibrionales bacterium]
MRIYKALLGFTFAVCLMLTAPMAWADSDTGVESVRMIADVSQLEKGGSFLIGIEFKLLPHWHLYWSNPGEFGVAPEFEFEIPEGFSMGSLRWPTPMKFKQRKDILGYGYEETVMLSVPIQSNPADTLGRNPQFTAQVRWLACNLDRCVPGKQKVSHTISVRNDRILAYTQEFEAHARSLPLDDPSRDELVTITKQGTLKAGGAPA